MFAAIAGAAIALAVVARPQLIAAADALLYAAKEGGRDRTAATVESRVGG